MEQLIERFYDALVCTLPFKDTKFIARLKTAGLFHGDLKEKLESMPTSAERASYFLDFGIKKNYLNFSKLLEVMEKFDYEPAQDLARKIKGEHSQSYPKPGTYMSAY